jgi:hypothetical protein
MSNNLNTSQAVERREHDLAKQAKRVISTDPFGGLVTDGNFDVLFDGDYVGQAQLGTATSTAGWQIMKVNNTGVSFADSTDGFTKVWDNRATYTFSN